MKKRIAIFASGSGTNAQNIARYFKESPHIEVALIVSSRRDAYVTERAHSLGIPCVVMERTEFATADAAIELMRRWKIDLIVLAGFLLLLPPSLVHEYDGRIVNIHPSLLPKFGGKGMYGDRVHQAVIESGESQSGITIHAVNERYDEGAILFQATCPVLPGDTPHDVATRVHTLEYEHYPRVIEQLLTEKK